MLQRIATCLCHPKMVGMFFKDKYRYAISLVMIFFAMVAGLAAIVLFNTNLFSYDDARYIEKLVRNVDDTTLVFNKDTNNLTGDSVVIADDTITVCFLRNSSVKYGNLMTYDFKDTFVDVYYQTIKIGTVSYSEFNLPNNIDLSLVASGRDSSLFLDFVSAINSKCEKGMQTIYYGLYLFTVITDYLIVIFISFIATYMINNTIDFKMRLKLILMSTLIYFVVLIFSLLFGYGWIKYLASIIPVIYAMIALFHIRKVKKV